MAATGLAALSGEHVAQPVARVDSEFGSDVRRCSMSHVRSMTRLRAFIVMAMAFCAAPSALAQEFGWFAQVVGSCWKGAFPDGTTVHRQCYTRQFDRFIRGTAELFARRDDKDALVFQGDSLFAWNASTATIEYYIWGTDGSHRQLTAQYVDEELHFPVPSRQDPNKVTVRSVWKRLGETSFEVRRERASSEGWKTELRVVYHRER